MKFGNQTKTTDYIGNMIYENGALKRILVDGGYVENGQYHFYIQDHLGNNRVVANADGTVIQTNHYYSFGMTFMEDGTHDTKAQPYKYNGKEFDGERGLNLYDYLARSMDPAEGRFTSIDPLAEKFYSVSPYVYCGNNPMNLIDPDGKAPQDPPTGIGFYNWSPEKQIRVNKIIKSTNAAGNRVSKGTNVKVSVSAWKFKGNFGVGFTKGSLSFGLFNFSAKTDGQKISTTASAVEFEGKMSISSVSAKAGITIAEGKANSDASTSCDAVSAEANVQSGANVNAKVNDQGQISIGAGVGSVEVNSSFNLQAAAEWFCGAFNFISEFLSPELKMNLKKEH